MLCTSAPASPRRAPVRRGATLDAMVDAVREQVELSGVVQKDDLKRAGFTEGEIASHGETAIARVRRARQAS